VIQNSSLIGYPTVPFRPIEALRSPQVDDHFEAIRCRWHLAAWCGMSGRQPSPSIDGDLSPP